MCVLASDRIFSIYHYISFCEMNVLSFVFIDRLMLPTASCDRLMEIYWKWKKFQPNYQKHDFFCTYVGRLMNLGFVLHWNGDTFRALHGKVFVGALSQRLIYSFIYLTVEYEKDRIISVYEFQMIFFQCFFFFSLLSHKCILNEFKWCARIHDMNKNQRSSE